MPIVNYVREHTRFIEYASDERLTGSERLLWYALMHIFNQRAQGRVWPEGFIRISNDRLLTYSAMKFDTLAAARNRLKQRGLIDFLPGKGSEKGKEKAVNPMYRMNYFFPEDANDHPEIPDGDSPNLGDHPIFPDGRGYGPGYGRGYGPGDGRGYGRGDITINVNDTQDKPDGTPVTPEEEEDEEEESSSIPARERMQERMGEVIDSWRKSYGTSPSPGVVQLIAGQADRLGFEEGVIGEAVREACENDAKNPPKYMLALFADWKDFGVKTREDVEQYLDLRDTAMNDHGFMREFAEQELDRMRGGRNE